MLAQGKNFALLPIFVYAPNLPLLPEYDSKVHGGGVVRTGHYMIDFQEAYTVLCNKVRSPSDSPVESKRLELTSETREELRQKLAHYYGRVPEEDEVI